MTYAVTVNPDGSRKSAVQVLADLADFRHRERTSYEAALEIRLERELEASAIHEAELTGDLAMAARREERLRAAMEAGIAALDAGDPAAARTALREALDEWGPE